MALTILLKPHLVKPSAIQSLLFEKENLSLALKDFSLLLNKSSCKNVSKQINNQITYISGRLLELDRIFNIINLKIENK